jgi:hypothetical protein
MAYIVNFMQVREPFCNLPGDLDSFSLSKFPLLSDVIFESLTRKVLHDYI